MPSVYLKPKAKLFLARVSFCLLSFGDQEGHARINKSILMIADCFRAKNDKTHVKREGNITLEIKVSVSI